MAEPWRAPHPHQQDPEEKPEFQYQQQAPGVMGPPRAPPPPYPVGSCQVSLCNPNEGVQTGGRRSSNPYTMTPAQVFTAVLGDPPPAHILHQLLTTPSPTDNPKELSHSTIDTFTEGGQAPVDPIPESPYPHYPPSYAYHMQRAMEDQGPSTSRAGTEEVQTPTSPQVPGQSGYLSLPRRVCDDPSSATDDDAESLSYSPTTPEPAPAPAQWQKNERGRPVGPAPVQPLQSYVRQRLQNEYGVVPEFIEANLKLLPEGRAKTEHDREMENILHSQLHSVPQGPFRMFMHSLPLSSRAKLRRLRRDSYAIKKGENHTLSREYHLHTNNELLRLRTQLREMTQFRDALLTELATLRGRLATQQLLGHQD